MLELTLRATAILLTAWLLTKLMPRATAATRHLVWHGALLAIVLAPLVAAANLPQVPVVPEGTALRVREILAALEAPSTGAAIDTPQSAAVRAPGRDRGATRDQIELISAAGTTVVAFWFLAGWLAAARLAGRARPAPAAWQVELTALCQRLRIGREVRLRMVDEPCSPLATGLFRSVILVPRTSLTWSDERRRAVLLHELAHVTRHDCRVQLVTHIACAMYWFNPLVWLAAAELRRERERACDDQVLHLGALASSYATHLLDIARELQPTLRPSAALAMARPSELEGRLLSVLAAGRARVPLRATRWLVVGVLAVTSLAAASLTAAPPSANGADALSAAATRYVVASDVMSSSPDASGRAEAETTLREAPDADERERAALALAFSSGRDVVPALLKALADPAAQVREKAAIGLALRRDPRVIEPLIAALADTDSQVREKAAIALGTSGDQRALDALTRALDDPDAQVREKAAAGLTLFGLTR
jgi:beta-lactamase regulating signal transducer with metallopeptidase domain